MADAGSRKFTIARQALYFSVALLVLVLGCCVILLRDAPEEFAQVVGTISTMWLGSVGLIVGLFGATNAAVHFAQRPNGNGAQ
jgi:hypothetical protein